MRSAVAALPLAPLLSLVFVVSGSSAALAEASVTVLEDLIPGAPGSYPSYLTVEGDYLYFRANRLAGGNDVELWRYDGATAELLGDISPGPTGSDPSWLTFWNGKLYFGASDGTGKNRLWVYDGSGVSLAPGWETQASLPEELTVYQGSLYFRATRYGGYPGLLNIGTELWKFDGTTQAPIDVFPGPGNSYPQHFIEWRGKLWFNAGAPNDGTELFVHDGSTTALAVNINPTDGSSPENFVVLSDELYFSALADDRGRELWAFDGVTARRRTDIFPGAEASNPYGMTVYDGAIYFGAEDGVHGYELWRYSAGVAELVADINENPILPGVDPIHHSFPSRLTVFDGVLYFAADDGIHGQELWSYDGAEVRMVADIFPGQYGSYPQELTVFKGKLLFVADDGVLGSELGTTKDLWRIAPVTEIPYRRGDANLDGEVDLSDSIAILLHLFAGSGPLSCEKGADWDDSGVIDISDAISLLDALFLGAPPPVATAGSCGLDATADALTCDFYPFCE